MNIIRLAERQGRVIVFKLIDEIAEVIYVADIETYELLYLNSSVQKTIKGKHATVFFREGMSRVNSAQTICCPGILSIHGVSPTG